MTSRKALFLAVLLVAAMPSYAQWSTDPAENTRVNPYGINPRATPDGGGGAIIVWEDDYGDPRGREVVAQRVDSSGHILWPWEGVPICAEIRDQVVWDGDIVGNGRGGAYIAWVDHRRAVRPDMGYWDSLDVYIQHVDANGRVLWAQNGIRVSSGREWGSHAKLVADAAGGVFVAWYSGHKFGDDWPDVKLQRINPAGEFLWPEDQVVLPNESELNVTMISDGAGGVILTTHGTVTRVDSSGTVLWQFRDVPGYFSDHCLIPDGRGGAIFYFAAPSDSRYKFFNLSLRRVDARGKLVWGRLVSRPATRPRYPWAAWIVPDGSGGVFMSWIDSSEAFHYTRLDSEGRLAWQPYTRSFGYIHGIFAPNLMYDGEGALIVVYHDSTTDNYRGFMQKLGRSGEKRWGSNGVLFSEHALYHFGDMISDGKGGVIAVWFERSWEPHFGIFAQRVNRYGRLGCITAVRTQPRTGVSSDYVLFPNWPNPFNAHTTIAYTLPRRARVRLTILNAAGQEVRTLVDEVQPLGHHSVVWDGRDRRGVEVPSGVYLCRLRANGTVRSGRLVLER